MGAKWRGAAQVKCRECGDWMRCDSLKEHLMAHLPLDRRPFPCDQCSASFVRPTYLLSHRRHTHRPGGRKLAHRRHGQAAGLGPGSSPVMTAGALSVTANGPPTSAIARRSAVEPSTQTVTTRIASDSRCHRCDCDCPTDLQMALHMKSAHSRFTETEMEGILTSLRPNLMNAGSSVRSGRTHDVLLCTKCNMKCERKRLRLHAIRYHLPRDHWPFPCDQCSLMFPTTFHLIIHRRRNHLGSDARLASSSDAVTETAADVLLRV